VLARVSNVVRSNDMLRIGWQKEILPCHHRKNISHVTAVAGQIGSGTAGSTKDLLDGVETVSRSSYRTRPPAVAAGDEYVTQRSRKDQSGNSRRRSCYRAGARR
jgi:hypothetical protein